jgi:hypothetical protein
MIHLETTETPFFDAQLGEERSSVHTDRFGNPLIEPSLRPTVPFLPPDPPNKAILKEAIKEKWLDGVRQFFEVNWISSPSTIIPCSIRGTTVEAHLNLSVFYRLPTEGYT